MKKDKYCPNCNNKMCKSDVSSIIFIDEKERFNWQAKVIGYYCKKCEYVTSEVAN